jgi:hypothetical protein
VVDSIVECDAAKLSCGQLKPRILAMEARRKRGDVLRIYDEAAKLFAIEMAQHELYYAPTQKKQNDKSNNISAVRDLLLTNKLIIAEECKEVIKDLYGYRYDERGKIVKEQDDCCDCVLYFVAETGYFLQLNPINGEPKEERRFHTPYQDLTRKDDMDFVPDFENKHEDEDFNECGIWDLIN